jgi:uncharacterized membrane protein HdeD (DUF308 family)
MSQLASAPPGHRPHQRWKLFLVLAALLVVLGLCGLTVSTFLQLTSLFVFGPLLLVSSILQLLIAFFSEERKQSLMHLAAAGLEMIFGFFIMGNPVENVMSLVSVVAVFLIVIGLARLGRLLAAQPRARGWILMTAIVALLLGVSALLGGTAGKLALLGVCVALDFVFHGVSWFMIALAERKQIPNA